MKIRTTFQGMSPSEGEGVRDIVSAWADKHLEPIMQGFGFGQSELAVTVSKRAKGAKPYHVKMHMHVPPKKIIAAHAKGDELRPAIDGALERLLREVQKHISRIRHQEMYKRKARRKRLHELKAMVAELPQEQTASISGMIEKLVPRLEKAVRREVAYLRNQGDLPPSYPAVQDVVDEVVAMIKAKGSRETTEDALYLEMLKAMHEVLDREVRNSRMFGQAESLEQQPQPDAEDQAEAMVGEEIMEFYQPDEVLKLEDVISDEEIPEPEEVVEAIEEEEEAEAAEPVTEYALMMMSDLPIQWRRALMLREFENLSPDALATLFDEETATVTTWIETATQYVVERMKDAGFEVDEAQPLKIQTR